jgi:hypothetical protein
MYLEPQRLNPSSKSYEDKPYVVHVATSVDGILPCCTGCAAWIVMPLSLTGTLWMTGAAQQNWLQ